MSTLLTVYQDAMQRLLERMDQKHPQYNLALIFQARLAENIDKTRWFGDTENRRSERWEIINGLNSLTREVIGTTFNSLCMFGNTVVNKDVQVKEGFSNLSSVHNYIELLWEVTRNACNLFNIGTEEDIWPPQCEEIIRGFTHSRKPLLPSDAAFVELEITLAYIDEVVQNVVGLIDEFSSNGRKTTKQSTSDRLFTLSHSFCRDLMHWKSEITALQADLVRLCELFVQEDVLWTEYYAQLSITLSSLKNTASEVCLILNKAISAGHEIAISLEGCELVVMLCYMEEQINLLSPLIDRQKSMDWVKSKRRARARQEVNNVLAGLIESVEAILRNLRQMMVLCDQRRFQDRNVANLSG